MRGYAPRVEELRVDAIAQCMQADRIGPGEAGSEQVRLVFADQQGGIGARGKPFFLAG